MFARDSVPIFAVATAIADGNVVSEHAGAARWRYVTQAASSFDLGCRLDHPVKDELVVTSLIKQIPHVIWCLLQIEEARAATSSTCQRH